MVKWINYVELENSVEDFENFCGVKIPDDLKEVVTKYNKGMPRPSGIPLEKGKKAEFYRLISFNKNEKFNVYSVYDDMMRAFELVPFAMTTNGSFICLKNNSIVLFNYEHKAIRGLCESFTILLNILE